MVVHASALPINQHLLFIAHAFILLFKFQWLLIFSSNLFAWLFLVQFDMLAINLMLYIYLFWMAWQKIIRHCFQFTCQMKLPCIVCNVFVNRLCLHALVFFFIYYLCYVSFKSSSEHMFLKVPTLNKTLWLLRFFWFFFGWLFESYSNILLNKVHNLIIQYLMGFHIRHTGTL